MRRKRRKQSITENRRKWRKISIYKEFLRYDKNIIYLPRQCLRDGAKALSLLGFLDGNVEFTLLEDRIGNQDVGKTYVFFD